MIISGFYIRLPTRNLQRSAGREDTPFDFRVSRSVRHAMSASNRAHTPIVRHPATTSTRSGRFAEDSNPQVATACGSHSAPGIRALQPAATGVRTLGCSSRLGVEGGSGTPSNRPVGVRSRARRRREQTHVVLDFAAAGLGLQYGTVRLVPAEDAWASIARALAADISRVLDGHAIEVEHIGSTAIPGLLAKPIIDLAVALRPGTVVEEIAEPLSGLGWIYRGDAGEDGGWVFVMDDAPWHRVAHAHGVPFGSSQWVRYLQLRDLLRQSAAARQTYAEASSASRRASPTVAVSTRRARAPRCSACSRRGRRSLGRCRRPCIGPDLDACGCA